MEPPGATWRHQETAAITSRQGPYRACKGATWESRRSQEEPGGARKSQEEPGGARRSQEEPPGSHLALKNRIFGFIFGVIFWISFGHFLDHFWVHLRDFFLGPDQPKRGQDGRQEAHQELQSPENLHLQNQ